jgi:hypothetical protein
MPLTVDGAVNWAMLSPETAAVPTAVIRAVSRPGFAGRRHRHAWSVGSWSHKGGLVIVSYSI